VLHAFPYFLKDMIFRLIDRHRTHPPQQDQNN
jgi:hypothetical protein